LATQKKFGTFGGVFTPSILTILGVIMYLRLPWIVGQSGLVYTIVIIVIAHIVSITTGLSVSSIATDKKVEAGGDYYIISRSLGLPIGGTIGIALFVGLSFSVSLYVIGFCENLLSVLNIPLSLNSIRLYGSAALLGITIITFISTSLAIKTQFIILAALLLSLISIFLGGSDMPVEQPAFTPPEDNKSLYVVFGIFFPAVTGFTAGVQMSGDLRNAKKSIPIGTISAIVFGLVVYLFLAAFLAYKVPVEQLISNPNILMDIAWNRELVIAGIWGATISSALGSILGAPRILQAASKDNVTPNFFARGSKKTNEPRRALFLTFIIAEAGILIGDLNVIAQIVSIFFISTYGLMNLSYALESWASTDFRPTFKVPVWVGMLGSLTCAIIMFELDVLAFFGATIVLSLIYLLLKRKELTLETGDTWGSFWSSIVRSGLHRLNEYVIHKRNWRPNILLFRGPHELRTNLLNLSKWLTGKTGIISDFELVETENDNLSFSKASQQVKLENDEASGIFHRRYECENVYNGIEFVSRFYGFSGLEPNTVLFGWPKNSKHPEKVAALLKKLIGLDYNILLLNQDENKPFDAFDTIDIWWRGGSNNTSLALALMRFLTGTNEWNEARVRLMIIIDDGALISKVHSNMQHLLQTLRQNAEVKIINNSIEKKDYKDIIKMESANTNLTLIGLPFIQEDANFIKNNTHFIKDLKAVLFIKASTFFEPFYIGIEKIIDGGAKSTPEKVKYAHIKIDLPADEVFAGKISDIHNRLVASLSDFYSYITELERHFKSLGEELKELTVHNFNVLSKNPKKLKPDVLVKLIARIRIEIFLRSQEILKEFKTNKLGILYNSLQLGIENVLQLHSEILVNCPETAYLYFNPDELVIEKIDPLSVKILKLKKKINRKVFKWEINIPVKFKAFVNYHINGFLRKQLLQHLKHVGAIGYGSVSDLQNIFNRIHDLLKNLENISLTKGELTAAEISSSIETIKTLFSEYSVNAESSFFGAINSLYDAHHQSFQNKVNYFSRIEINHIIKKRFKLKKAAVQTETFQSVPSRWKQNMDWVIDFADMELSLILLKSRLAKMLNRWLINSEDVINEKLNRYFKSIENTFKSFINKQDLKKIPAVEGQQTILPDINTKELTVEIQKLINDLPEVVDVMTEEFYKSLAENQFEEPDVVSVHINRLVGYLITTEFMQDLNEEAEKFNASIKESIVAIEDTQRLITSSIQNAEDKSERKSLADEEENSDHLIGHGLSRLSKSKEKVEQQINELKDYVKKNLQSAFDQMNPYLMTQSTHNLKQYILGHEQRKVLGKIESVKESITGFFQKLIVTLQYFQSEGILFARKLNRIDSKDISVIDKFISFTQIYSPAAKVFNSVPRYYTQLFSPSNTVSSQYLISRESALNYAEKIYRRFAEGFSGALLVNGESGSGKSSLSRLIAAKFFEKDKIYRLNPKAGGSISIDVFKLHINECFGQYGSIKQVFDSVPRNSVLIVNKLEMWWQRSYAGFEVIDLLLNLIDKYSNKIFFIININVHTFRLLNKIQNIEQRFSGIVNTESFNAKDIERAILLRHNSTGLKFRYNNRLENRISEIGKARLFNTIFKYSKGTIGVALQTWLSMINDFSDDTVVLQKLPSTTPGVLANLNQEWIVWLTEFILHRELTIKRLSAIFSLDEKEIFPLVEALVRSGFIIKRADGILKINPFIEHFLINHFCQTGNLWNN
jgi:amino acid transporter